MSDLTMEAQGLSKVYGSFTALSNLNLKIEGAKCVGFLGPNGAGKTTTLKIFTDLSLEDIAALMAEHAGNPGARSWR